MFRYLPLIVKNCWRNRRRTTLTIVSIGVSMCLLGVLMAVYHAFYLSDPTPDQALRLVTRNRVSLTVPIPLYLRRPHPPGARRQGGHDLAVVRRRLQGCARSQEFLRPLRRRTARSCSRSMASCKIPEDQKQAFLHDRTGCVIGRDLADKFNFHVGDRITLIGDIFPGTLELTVRGIFDSPRTSEVLYFNWAYVRGRLAEGRKGDVGTFNIVSTTRMRFPAWPKPSTTNSTIRPCRPAPKPSRPSCSASFPCSAT